MFVAFKLQQTKLIMIIYFNDINNITNKYNLFFLMTQTTIFNIEKVV